MKSLSWIRDVWYQYLIQDFLMVEFQAQINWGDAATAVNIIFTNVGKNPNLCAKNA